MEIFTRLRQQNYCYRTTQMAKKSQKMAFLPQIATLLHFLTVPNC